MKFNTKQSVTVTRALLSAVISSQLIAGSAFAQDVPTPEAPATEGATGAENAAGAEDATGAEGGAAGGVAGASALRSRVEGGRERVRSREEHPTRWEQA